MIRFTLSCSAIALGLLSCEAIAKDLDTKSHLDFSTALRNLTDQDRNRLSENLGIDADLANIQHGERLLYPDVNVNLGQTWEKDAQLDRPNPPRADLAVEAKANLFAFGRDSARLDALAATRTSLNWKRKAIDLEAEHKAAELLLDAIGFGFQKAVIEEAKASRRDFRNRMRLYFESGRLPKDEIDRLDIDMNSLDLEYEQVLNRQTQADLKIKARLSEDFLLPSWPLEKILRAGKDQVFIDRVAGTAANSSNPQLGLERSELEIRHARYEVSRKNLLPTLDLEAKVSSPIGKREGESNAGSVLLAITYPLINSESSSHLAESSYRQVLAQEEKLAYVAMDIQESRQSSRSELAIELKQFRDRQALLTKATSMQSISRRGFETGLVKYSELSLDEQRVHQLKLDAMRSLQKIHMQTLELCHSQGLSWMQCVPSNGLDN